MFAGGVGPTSSILILLFVPISGAFLLSTEEFAVWAILNSVATISLAIDFGGVAYATANAGKVDRPGSVVLRGAWISASGSVLVCLIAMIVWVPYSESAAAGGWSVQKGELALVTIMGATVLRSASSVMAAAALARFDYKSRNILLLGQSAIATVLTVGLLVLTASAWALPIGWLIAATVSVAFVAPRLVRDYRRPAVSPSMVGDDMKVGTPGQFACKRTTAALLGSLLLQGDRWVIGAIAGPEFLAAYELVWRFASAPRILAMNVSAVLVSDARTAQMEGRLSQLLRDSSRAVWMVSLVVGAASATGIVGLGAIHKVSWLAVTLGFAVLIALTINGRTSVTSMVGIGIGRVGIDLPYLVVTVVSTSVVWVIASATSSGLFLVAGSAAVLSLTSIVFFRRIERPMGHARITS